MNDFWYPWYPDVFAANTMHLTLDQECIYRRLIDHYMKTRQPLQDSDIALARAAGVGLDCFAGASSTIRAFFKQKNGKLYHSFCDEQLDIQDTRSRKRSEIASKAARARHQQYHDDKSIEHASSMLQAQQMPATGQDKTEQDKEESNTRAVVSHETKPQASAQNFEKFWKEFPGGRPKGNKKMAWIKFKKTVNQGVKENDLIESAGNYRKFCDATGSFNQHAATWLNQRGWETNWLEQDRPSSGQAAHHHRGANGGGQSVSEISAALKAKILAGDSAGPERSVTDLAREPEGAGSGFRPSGVLLEVPALVWEET